MAILSIVYWLTIVRPSLIRSTQIPSLNGRRWANRTSNYTRWNYSVRFRTRRAASNDRSSDSPRRDEKFAYHESNSSSSPHHPVRLSRHPALRIGQNSDSEWPKLTVNFDCCLAGRKIAIHFRIWPHQDEEQGIPIWTMIFIVWNRFTLEHLPSRVLTSLPINSIDSEYLPTVSWLINQVFMKTFDSGQNFGVKGLEVVS